VERLRLAGPDHSSKRALTHGSGQHLRYYFPTGQSNHIPYQQIHAAEVRPMGWLTGKGALQS
jgi:hypothetical protein